MEITILSKKEKKICTQALVGVISCHADVTEGREILLKRREIHVYAIFIDLLVYGEIQNT